MAHKVITQNDFSLASLTEIKNQVGLTSSQTYHDVRLGTLLSVAGSIVQSKLPTKMLSRGTVISEWSGNQQIYVHGGNVSAMTEVLVDGEPAEYSFSEITQKLTVNTTGDVYSATYEAGFDEVPHAAKQAGLLLIASMFRNPEEVITGQSVAKAPVTIDHLLHLIDPTAMGNVE